MRDLQVWICEENIRHFRAELVEQGDPERRRILSELLTLEQHALARLMQEDAKSRAVMGQTSTEDGSGGARARPGEPARHYVERPMNLRPAIQDVRQP